jgi:hypothetical protein
MNLKGKCGQILMLNSHHGGQNSSVVPQIPTTSLYVPYNSPHLNDGEICECNKISLPWLYNIVLYTKDLWI